VYDVIVVGASVAGCRTAELIALKGFRVLVLEEHKKVGEPIKCAGLVSWRIRKLFPQLPNNIFINKIKKGKFFSPNGNFFVLKSKKPAYVIDRKKLDCYLATKAKKAGVRISLNESFLNFLNKRNSIIVKTIRRRYETKILIGADGANSLVAKRAGIKQPSKIFVGIQTTAKGDFDSNAVELWFGSIAPKFFAWVIPENEKYARIGLASEKNSRKNFEIFMKRRIGKIYKPNVFGIIRTGLIKESVAERIMLVGDAACQVKPFSGGGIIYSLITSKICADATIKALENNKFDKTFLRKNYDLVWKEKLEHAIKKGLFYRKFLNLFSDKGLNLLFSLIKKFGVIYLEKFDYDLLK
jgi:geranylgeranyl reductase family protein